MNDPLEQEATEQLRRIFNESRKETNGWYKVTYHPRFAVSDGIKEAIDKIGGYWLMDTIAIKLVNRIRAMVEAEKWDYRLEFTIESYKDDTCTFYAKARTLDAPEWFEIHRESLEFTTWPIGTWTFELALQRLQWAGGQVDLGVVAYLTSED